MEISSLKHPGVIVLTLRGSFKSLVSMGILFTDLTHSNSDLLINKDSSVTGLDVWDAAGE